MLCIYLLVYPWLIPDLYHVYVELNLLLDPDPRNAACNRNRLPNSPRRSTPFIECTQIYLSRLAPLTARVPPLPEPGPEGRAAAGEGGAGRGSGSRDGSSSPAAAGGGGPPEGTAGAGALALGDVGTGGGSMLRRCFRTLVAACPLAPMIFRKSS